MNIRNRFYTVAARCASPMAVRARLPGRRALAVRREQPSALHLQRRGQFERRVAATEDVPTGNNLILSTSFERPTTRRLVHEGTYTSREQIRDGLGEEVVVDVFFALVAEEGDDVFDVVVVLLEGPGGDQVCPGAGADEQAELFGEASGSRR